MDKKKILGIVLIVLGVVLYLLKLDWWICLIVLVIGLAVLLCKCKKCVKKVEEPKTEEPAKEEEPAIKTPEEPAEMPTEEPVAEVPVEENIEEEDEDINI